MFCCSTDNFTRCVSFPHEVLLCRLKKLRELGKEKEARLIVCLKKAEDDIKEGANACQVYQKKAVIVRFIKSPIWEKRFADLMRKYDDHHKRFQFELTIEIAHSMDKAHEKLERLEEKQDRILSK